MWRRFYWSRESDAVQPLLSSGFFFSSRRRHTRWNCDWSSDVCSSDLRKLTAYKIGQAVRNDGPQTHLAKAGTPTMGGALVLISILTATLLWADLSNRFVWAVLVVTFGFGAIGWIDDYRKVVKNNPKGLSARAKFFWQSLIGLVAAVYLAFAVSASGSGQILELVSSW